MFSSFVQALTSRTASPHKRYPHTSCAPDLYLPPIFRDRKYKDHLAMAMTSVQELPKSEITAGKGTGFPEPLSEGMDTCSCSCSCFVHGG